MKCTLKKDLKIGQRYWIKEKGNPFSKFARPLIFIGYKSKRMTPWFTFGDSVEGWLKSFNFTAAPSKYNYYEDLSNKDLRY